MNIFARLRSTLHSLTARARVESQMDDELRFHIDAFCHDLIRDGVAPAEAARRARIEFGSIDAHKDAIRGSLGLRWRDELFADLRYGARMLAKSPGFTTIAVLSLALGIGANTTIFTLAKAVYLDRLAVPHPEQLRLLSWSAKDDATHTRPIHHIWGDFNPAPNGGFETTSFSYAVYQQLRHDNTSFSDLFAFKSLGGFDNLTATIDGAAESVTGELVSGNYYPSLGIRPVLGRSILPADDDLANTNPVALISYEFWSRHFNRSPSVIGKTILLNLHSVTIVGVNPPGFTGAASVQMSEDFFLPVSLQPVLMPRGKLPAISDPGTWWLQVMGRLKPGVSDRQAVADLSLKLDQAIRATVPVSKNDTMPVLALDPGSRGQNHAQRKLGQPIHVLLALTSLVLLLACANLANLLLARSTARQREISVRMALGATRGRILRQVLTESLMLSALGGIIGLALGYLSRNVIPKLMSNSWEPSVSYGSFDGTIFAFTFAVSILAGLLFGIAPAWQATRTEVNTGLKESATTATRRRKGFAGRVMVVFQVALSILLVITAGLFSRTLINLSRVDPGFNASNLLLFSIQPPAARYPHPKDVAIYFQIEQRLRSIPATVSVSLSQSPLLAHDIDTEGFVPEGTPEAADHRDQDTDSNKVGQDFFTTMSIPILSGRSFNSDDTETSPKVAIVNQALVKKFFPNIDPIGKTFNKEHIQIVGICADAKYDDLRGSNPPTFYTPYRQVSSPLEIGMTFEIRTRSGTSAVLGSIREAIRSIDRDLPLIAVRTQTEQVDALLQQERLFAILTSAFGALAISLAAIGIYGIMAFNVSRRTNEIGIRMALGARTDQVLRMILGEASALALVGILLGLGSALALTRLLQSMLFDLSPHDPVTLSIAALLLLAVALLAGYGPARRAARIDPMQALRHD